MEALRSWKIAPVTLKIAANQTWSPARHSSTQCRICPTRPWCSYWAAAIARPTGFPTSPGHCSEIRHPEGLASRLFGRPVVRISLSAPGGGEGRGEVGISESFPVTHLTLPSLRDGPLPLPPEGRRGILHRG